MKAARLHEYDEHMNVDLQLEDLPEPEISAPDDVIVRIGAAGLCRTDLHIIEGVWKDIQDKDRTLLPYILKQRTVGRGIIVP
jgi:NAD+-dependent secondary alcohol dehydrogenase Adh1